MFLNSWLYRNFYFILFLVTPLEAYGSNNTSPSDPVLNSTLLEGGYRSEYKLCPMQVKDQKKENGKFITVDQSLTSTKGLEAILV